MIHMQLTFINKWCTQDFRFRINCTNKKILIEERSACLDCAHCSCYYCSLLLFTWCSGLIDFKSIHIFLSFPLRWWKYIFFEILNNDLPLICWILSGLLCFAAYSKGRVPNILYSFVQWQCAMCISMYA